MAASRQISKVSYRHDAIIDWLLENPNEKTKERLARELNVTRTWLSIVMNSDAFKRRYEERRREYNEQFGASVIHKLHRVSVKALDALARAVDEDECSPRELCEVSRVSLQSLGYGTNRAREPVVQYNETNIAIVDKDVLAKARDSMKRVIDVPKLPAESG